MVTQISPGIVITESEFDAAVPLVSTSTGGIAGVFKWGPVGSRTFVEDKETLSAKFWQPTDFNAETWFSAFNFLSYGGPLWVVRAANTTATSNANAAYNALGYDSGFSHGNAVAQVVKNDVDYANKDGTFDSLVKFIAKYPGDLGNSLRISAVYTPDEFQSTINLTSYGFVTTDFESGGGIFSINSGSRTATVTITANSASTANTLASNLVALIQTYDAITVGTAKIGKWELTVKTCTYNSANADLSGNTTIGTAVVRFRFYERFTRPTNWTSTTLNRRWEYSKLLQIAPGTSPHVNAHGNADAVDEMHLVVVDEKGKFTGVPKTVLEVFKSVSRANDAFGLDHSSIFYKNVINQQSRYLWVANDRTDAPSANAQLVASADTTEPLYLQLQLGSDGPGEDDVDIEDLANAWDLFVSPEEVDVSVLVLGKARGGTVGEQHFNYVLDNIAEIRKDVVVFGSPAQNVVVNNFGDEATDLVSFRNVVTPSSYGFLDSGYKYQYDQFNNIYRWIPLCGDCAGVTVRTDLTNDPWWPVAGFNRGQIKNIIKLAFNPNQADRDLLYPNGINPVVSFAGQGTVLFGQKTLLDVESGFNRLNVRRLFIYLEKGIGKLARQFLFEFNDPITRAYFTASVNPFLRDVQSRRGIVRYLFKCDADNNTDEVTAQERMIAQVFIQANRAAEMIELDFFDVGGALQFSEITNAGISA